MRIITSGVILWSVALDQASKHIFEPQTINSGIAFGIPVPSDIVLGIYVAVILILGYILVFRYQQHFNKGVYYVLGLGLLLGGVLGNTIDRIMFNGVRDFIHVVSFFPAFNIADAVISLGVLILLFYEIRHQRKPTNALFAEDKSE